MRFGQCFDARHPVGRSLRALTGLIVGGVTTILLIANGLPLGAFRLPAFDLTLAVLFVARRVGFVRTALFWLGVCLLVAALAPPGCYGVRPRSYVTTLKSDLRNLATWEEIHFADHRVYTSSFEDLEFVHSEGVAIVLIASQAGWTAWATHVALGPSEGCAVYYSDAPLPAFDDVEPSVAGKITCTM